MKKQVFTLLTLLLVGISGAWGATYTDTYTTYNGNAVKTISEVKYLSCGLLTMITFDNANVARNSGGTQITKSTTGTFTVYSRIPGLTIASIEMTTSNDPATGESTYSATNGTLTYNSSTKKYTFTPSGTPTSTQISITASGSATCLNPITITLTGNALSYEQLSTFANGNLGFTSTAATSDLTLTTTNSNKAKGNGTNLSFQNGGDITFTAATKKIKYITLCYDQYMATGFTDNVEGSYSVPNILWTAPTGGVSSVKLTQTNSSTATISKILVVYESATTTIGATGWSTYSNAKALDFANAVPSNPASADLKAYMITGAAGTSITKSAALDDAPGSTGLLINGTAGETYSIPVLASSSTSTTGNLMKPCVTATTVNYDDNAGFNYVLMNNSGTPEFQKIVSGTYSSANVGAGKAYLALSEDPGSRALSLFDDETTALQEIQAKGVIENGQLYNLAGQRVAQPTKGLYIVNGKKVIIK